MKFHISGTYSVLKCTDFLKLISGVWRYGLSFVVHLSSQCLENPISRKSYQLTADTQKKELLIPAH